MEHVIKNLTSEEIEAEVLWADSNTCAQQVMQNLKGFTPEQQTLFCQAEQISVELVAQAYRELLLCEVIKRERSAAVPPDTATRLFLNAIKQQRLPAHFMTVQQELDVLMHQHPQLSFYQQRLNGEMSQTATLLLQYWDQLEAERLSA